MPSYPHTQFMATLILPKTQVKNEYHRLTLCVNCVIYECGWNIMITDRNITAAAEDAGLRLEKVILNHCPSSTRQLVIDALTHSSIIVNGSKAIKGSKIKMNDKIRVAKLLELSDIKVTPNTSIPVDVIYEDETILAVNKPAGLPVHPLHHSEQDTLCNGLAALRKGMMDIGDNPLFPAFVHRLDADTSGLMLACKTNDAYFAMRTAFSERQVTKIYRALIHGKLTTEGKIVNQLEHLPRNRGRMVIADNKPVNSREERYEAVSIFKTIERHGNFSLIEVEIETGITHQIRIQLANIGNPIVGDYLYGMKKHYMGIHLDRHFLHSYNMSFIHPASGKPITLTAPLTPDLTAFLAMIAG